MWLLAHRSSTSPHPPTCRAYSLSLLPGHRAPRANSSPWPSSCRACSTLLLHPCSCPGSSPACAAFLCDVPATSFPQLLTRGSGPICLSSRHIPLMVSQSFFVSSFIIFMKIWFFTPRLFSVPGSYHQNMTVILLSGLPARNAALFARRHATMAHSKVTLYQQYHLNMPLWFAFCKLLKCAYSSRSEVTFFLFSTGTIQREVVYMFSFFNTSKSPQFVVLVLSSKSPINHHKMAL